MSERDWRVLAQDILIEAEFIATTIAGQDARAALDDPMLSRALLHAIQTIGEAASKMPAEVQAAMPDLPWQAIRGTRNVIVHGYFGVDLDIIARTVAFDIPNLAERLRDHLDA
jgi:uncharacterized protein with HEPN domain